MYSEVSKPSYEMRKIIIEIVWQSFFFKLFYIFISKCIKAHFKEREIQNCPFEVF